MLKELSFLFLLLSVLSCEQEEARPRLEKLDFNYQNYVNRELEKPMSVLRRNIIVLDFSTGECILEGSKVNDSIIVGKIKRMLSSGKRYDPILDSATYRLAGDVLVPNYMISASYSPNLNYRKYSFWRSEIFRAINELRAEFAEKRFQKNYWDLLDSPTLMDKNMLREIHSIYPLRYSEYVMD